jgi:hypothetical protein
MLKIRRNSLLPMEPGRVASCGSEGVRFREKPLAVLEVLEAHAVDVRCEVRELAEAAVAVPVEGADQGAMMVVASERAEDWMLVNPLPELAADVVALRDLAEDIDEVVRDCKPVFAAEVP